MLSFPFKFTVYKTKQLQMFLTVFSHHLYILMYGHTIPQANSHACWTYVYADGYICIVDSFPFHCSSLPLSVIDTCIALIPSGITAVVLPQGKTSHPIAKTVDSVCVCCVPFSG